MIKGFKKDGERAEKALKKAMAMVKDAYVPLEIIMLTMLLDQRLDPKDAIAVAYLLGKEESNE